MNENNFVQSNESSQRQMRVQEILRAALNEILVRGESKNYILDENIITITHVDVSPDLRNAKFLFIPADTKQIDQSIIDAQLQAELLEGNQIEFGEDLDDIIIYVDGTGLEKKAKVKKSGNNIQYNLDSVLIAKIKQYN